jgi:hypothetical protein
MSRHSTTLLSPYLTTLTASATSTLSLIPSSSSFFLLPFPAFSLSSYIDLCLRLTEELEKIEDRYNDQLHRERHRPYTHESTGKRAPAYVCLCQSYRRTNKTLSSKLHHSPYYVAIEGRHFNTPTLLFTLKLLQLTRIINHF